jgi:hypothetical protein
MYQRKNWFISRLMVTYAGGLFPSIRPNFHILSMGHDWKIPRISNLAVTLHWPMAMIRSKSQNLIICGIKTIGSIILIIKIIFYIPFLISATQLLTTNQKICFSIPWQHEIYLFSMFDVIFSFEMYLCVSSYILRLALSRTLTNMGAQYREIQTPGDKLCQKYAVVLGIKFVKYVKNHT